MAENTPQLHISYGPHIRAGLSTTQIMWMVNAALVPALVWAFFIFGYQPVLITIGAIIGAVLGEHLVCFLRKRKTSIKDGSAVCTGILLAYTLPPGLNPFVAGLGAFLAIILSKGLFGGLGYNIFNVALIGRAILMSSYPVDVTTLWLTPKLGNFFPAEMVTTATPLALMKEKGLEAVLNSFQHMPDQMSYVLRMIVGLRPGSIGEVSSLFIMLGAGYLMWKKIIKLYIPLSIFAGVILMSFFSASPLIYAFGGGLWLGAFFMATDYVTSPTTPKGQIIFGLGIGILTGAIRLWGGYPEGICYAILLMNILTPALNDWFRPKRIFTQGATS